MCSLLPPSDAPLSSLEEALRTAFLPLLGMGTLGALGVRYLVQGSAKLPDFSGYLATIGLDPMNAGGFAALFFMFLLARPNSGIIQLSLLVGGIVETVYLFNYLPYTMPLRAKLLAGGAGFGVVGFVFLLGLAYFAESKVERQRARVFLGLSVLLLLYPFFASALFGSISLLRPMVYDQAGYLVEGCLGFVPSFEIAHYLHQHPNLDWGLQSVYNRLSAILVIGLGLSIVYEKRCYTNMFYSFAVSAFLANFFYLLLPMVGIDDFLGPAFWPNNAPAPSLNPVLYEAHRGLPRTCYPSLHGTWILIPFFVLFRASRVLALIFGLLAGLTIVAAMGPLVGHYLIDMIAAFPFVVGCLAISASSKAENRSQRLSCIIFGLSATTALALAIRWFPVVLAAHPWLTWGGMLSLVVVSCWLEARLAKASLDSVQSLEDH